MHQTKLLQVVAIFSQKERKRLEKFFLSPFFNENKMALQLIQYLISHIEKKDSLEKERIFAQLFPEEDYNDLKMRRLISDTFQLVTQFIAQLSAEKNPETQALNILKFYQEKNIENLYNSHFKQVIEIQKAIPQNASFFYNQYELLLTNVMQQTQNLKREGIEDLMPTVEQLDIFYIARKLEFFCTLLAQKNMIASEITISFWEEIADLTAKKPYLASVPIIAFYKNLLNLLHFPEKTEYFDETLNLLRQYPNLFNPVELRNIYTIVRSYCISKINTGNKIFEQKLWELYDSQIHNDAILNEEKEITPATFKNIIVLGIRLHKIVETEKIIQNYQIHLAANLRQDVVNYCYAKIYFYKKDYPPIVKLLNQMQYDDIFFQIDARKLLIQTYFELNEIEHLLSSMNSLRVYLYRNKTLSQHHKESNIQFLHILQKIINTPQASKKEKIMTQIKTSPHLSERAWLLEKLK